MKPPAASRPVAPERVSHAGATFIVATIDLGRAEVGLFWEREDGTRYGTLEAVRQRVEGEGRRALLVTNAGIFDPSRRPVGLHVERGVVRVPLNLAHGAGNFFLKPNGVFAVTKRGARVVRAEEYPAIAAETVLATQSGPVLVIGGELHPAFREGSENWFVRSGIGVRADGRVAFAISEGPVTFHALATLFRDKLGCAEALYLDGAIPQAYVPGAGRTDEGGDFAGILAAWERPPDSASAGRGGGP